MLSCVAIQKDKNSVFGVSVPSLAGCFSYGDTLDEAIVNTKEVIKFHIEGFLEDKQEPDIRQVDLDILQNDPNYAGASWFGLEVDISGLSLKIDLIF